MHHYSSMRSLHDAARMGNTKFVQLLLARGIGNNLSNAYGHTPLHIALRENHRDIVKLLIANGAEVIDSGLLSMAVGKGYKDIVELMIANGAKVNEKHLRSAAIGGHKDILKLLLAHGPEVSATVLYLAAEGGHQEIVELLLSHGAKVSPHVAALWGDMVTVRNYLEQGMDVNALDEYYSRTLLYEAAAAGHKEMTEFLLAKGAQVNVLEKHGQTPIHKAVMNKHKEIVELLIARGADINIRTYCADFCIPKASTLLHLVNTKDIAELLLAHSTLR